MYSVMPVVIFIRLWRSNRIEHRANMTPAETNMPGSATQVVFALLHPFLVTKDSNHLDDAPKVGR